LKVCGFTIVRNAIRFDYPALESIQSLLPLVDEMLVSVGDSEDDTLALIQSIDSPKIRIIRSTWDDSLREGGRVLAEETNKALAAIGPEFDWCFYLQADEILHERWIPSLKQAMEENAGNQEVQGLLFDYLHFYGSYHYLGDSRTWYRREVRIIRNLPGMQSYRDAQGFRFLGKKLQVKHSGAQINHYGWVKNPRFQQEKQKHFHKLWHEDEWLEKNVAQADDFDYSLIDSLRSFEGSHPAVMQERIRRCDWDFSFDVRKKKFSWKKMLLYYLEKWTGKRPFESRNYRLLP
jgi:glycosyltransferase involved in cell wall biosynthesis